MDPITSTETRAVRDLFALPGPFATVYFDLRATGEQEAHPRWREVTDELTRQGCGAGTVTALERRVLGAVPGPGVLAAVATGEEVLLTVDLPGADQPDLAAYDDLPHLLPLLTWLQFRPAYVAALVDRTGADVTAYPGGTGEAVSDVVDGPDDEIERNAPGGWSQGRYQHRAEDSWEHNSVRVGEVLTWALHEYDARILFLAGDVRALQYLEKHLPTQVKQEVTIRRVSGGRSPDGSWQRRAEQIADDLRLAVDETTAALLARLDEGRRPGGRAVEGAAPTLRALTEGRVRTLFLAGDPTGTRSAWYDPHGTGAALDPAVLELAGAHPRPGGLDEVAVRAALLTGADVRVVAPGAAGGPAEGIGALCRYA